MNVRYITCHPGPDGTDLETPCAQCWHFACHNRMCEEAGEKLPEDMDEQTQYPPWCPCIDHDTLEESLRTGKILHSDAVAELLGELLQTDCPCDYGHNYEWFAKLCPAKQDGSCPTPEDNKECWRVFVEAWVKREQK